MKIDFDRFNYLIGLLERCKTDPLKKFVAEPYADELERMREENLKSLFSLAKHCTVRYIFLGKGEICGCEDKRHNGWPAIWYITDKLGFSSCGNTDQHQTSDFAGLYFPTVAYGAWDLEESRRLSEDEFVKKKFNRVVTRDHKYYEIPIS